MTEPLTPLWQEYARTRSPEARERLIRASIPLVRLIAGQLRMHMPAQVEVEDLEGAGIPGLLAAMDAFDPGRGIDFGPYARIRIRSTILDDLRMQDPVARLARTTYKAIERAKQELEHALLRAPDDEEVAQAAGLDLDRYYHCLYLVNGGVQTSLTPPAGAASDYRSALRDQAPNPLEAASRRDHIRFLGKLIDDLPEQGREILSLYYGDGLTMREIATTLDVTPSQISHLHNTAIIRLRKKLHWLRIEENDLSILPARS